MKAYYFYVLLHTACVLIRNHAKSINCLCLVLTVLRTKIAGIWRVLGTLLQLHLFQSNTCSVSFLQDSIFDEINLIFLFKGNTFLLTIQNVKNCVLEMKNQLNSFVGNNGLERDATSMAAARLKSQSIISFVYNSDFEIK